MCVSIGGAQLPGRRDALVCVSSNENIHVWSLCGCRACVFSYGTAASPGGWFIRLRESVRNEAHLQSCRPTKQTTYTIHLHGTGASSLSPSTHRRVYVHMWSARSALQQRL
mmetsp:Transcript_10626/g.30712  ORF Transcript_10626/g.30712 Transcript_10626/m.30712 type:complete len:111 (-) Transcript_10626:435-767(-)